MHTDPARVNPTRPYRIFKCPDEDGAKELPSVPGLQLLPNPDQARPEKRHADWMISRRTGLFARLGYTTNSPKDILKEPCSTRCDSPSTLSTMAFPVNGKSAVITGAGSGMPWLTSKRLAEKWSLSMLVWGIAGGLLRDRLPRATERHVKWLTRKVSHKFTAIMRMEIRPPRS